MATKTKTPAEIPAETRAAHFSEYDPAMPLTAIEQHPDNPRHNAVADDELLASIKEQGLIHALVVFPHPTKPNIYMLADGHCRFDALTRAGYSHAKVEIRHDLTDRADQVAAMLATVRRRDLTPVEEAEGFDLLSELGWSVDAIAAKTGRAKSTVSERRKRTRLPENTRTAADSGQITIDEAVRVAKLPAAEQAKLEKVVHGSEFRYALANAERRVQALRELDAEVKRLKAAGVPQLAAPDVAWSGNLNHAEHGMVSLSRTGFPDASDHARAEDPCLAFTVLQTGTTGTVIEVCTDPGRHDDDLSEAMLERKKSEADAAAERERKAAEWKEAQAAKHTARQLRLDTIHQAIRPKAIDPALEGLLRVAVPFMVVRFWDDGGHLQDLCGVPDEQRWGQRSADRDGEWLQGLATAPAATLVKVLAAVMACEIEEVFTEYGATKEYVAMADAWAQTLQANGHELNAVDRELFDSFHEEDQ